MTADRYSRTLLTIIAIALVYLCIVLTPWPAVSAQRGLRPGDDTGPAQAVIVGWKADVTLPVQVVASVPLNTIGQTTVSGTVRTQQATDAVDRVVLTGWEESGGPQRTGAFVPLSRETRPGLSSGVPVTTIPPR
jgi:hypothetical protein